MSLRKNIGVFVAWPYANGDLHLGHVAGAYLPADIFARFNRLAGNKVLMVSGSDAHGTPITLKAKEEGLTALEVVKRYHGKFLEGWQALGISFDLFTHTHTKNHERTVQDVFRKLDTQGDLDVRSEKQFYDDMAGMFLPDRYVTGTCPLCGYVRARSDQCESCGKTFDSILLKDPISTLTKSKPVVRDTEHFFFLMDKYKERVLEYVEKQPHWRSHVQNFTVSMVQDGLIPRAITRDIDWGIAVPKAGWESKVIYVWFDAVVGYLSGSKEWAAREGKPDMWKDWWTNKDARGLYFIGKDNIPFHTVIWPIELMAYDSELNLPYDVPANQFLNISGEKFSTSRGLALWLLDVLKEYDADALRYYMATILPETKDANFSWDEFIAKNNGELVAAWGNLVNRVLGFAYSRYDGKVPEPGKLDERDEAMLKLVPEVFESVGKAYTEVRLRDALKDATGLAREVNKYLDVKAPWTVFKTDAAAAGTTIYVAMRVIDSLKILLAPVLPHTAEKLHQMLGYTEPLFGKSEVRNVSEEGGENYDVLWYVKNQTEERGLNCFVPSELPAGRTFSKPEPLYKILEPRTPENV